MATENRTSKTISLMLLMVGDELRAAKARRREAGVRFSVNTRSQRLAKEYEYARGAEEILEKLLLRLTADPCILGPDPPAPERTLEERLEEDRILHGDGSAPPAGRSPIQAIGGSDIAAVTQRILQEGCQEEIRRITGDTRPAWQGPTADRLEQKRRQDQRDLERKIGAGRLEMAELKLEQEQAEAAADVDAGPRCEECGSPLTADGICPSEHGSR